MAPDRSVKYWMPKRIQRHFDLTVKAIGEINPKLFSRFLHFLNHCRWRHEIRVQQIQPMQ